MFHPVRVDRAAPACEPKRLAIKHPHGLSVDLRDSRQPLLISPGRPLRPKILRLGHVSIGVDHPNFFCQLHHGHVLPASRFRRVVTYSTTINAAEDERRPIRWDRPNRHLRRGAGDRANDVARSRCAHRQDPTGESATNRPAPHSLSKAAARPGRRPGRPPSGLCPAVRQTASYRRGLISSLGER